MTDGRTVDSLVAEMRRKMAWAIGSTLGITYFGERTAAKIFATKASIAIVESHAESNPTTWGDPWKLLEGD